MSPLNIFIGYDPRQPIAYQVAAHSIARHSSKPVAISPLRIGTLPISRMGLTQFTFSRFLVPWLCDFQGHAIFMDSDVVCLGDVVELLACTKLDEVTNGPAAAWVAKNKLIFEWPSVMVFDCVRSSMLTPDYVDDPKNALFDFSWASRVGEFPLEWNFLVGYDKPSNKPPKLIHYTQGIPIWPETKDSVFAEKWLKEFALSTSSCSFDELMGRSVHAGPVRQRLAAATTPSMPLTTSPNL